MGKAAAIGGVVDSLTDSQTVLVRLGQHTGNVITDVPTIERCCSPERPPLNPVMRLRGELPRSVPTVPRRPPGTMNAERRVAADKRALVRFTFTPLLYAAASKLFEVRMVGEELL